MAAYSIFMTTVVYIRYRDACQSSMSKDVAALRFGSGEMKMTAFSSEAIRHRNALVGACSVRNWGAVFCRRLREGQLWELQLRIEVRSE